MIHQFYHKSIVLSTVILYLLTAIIVSSCKNDEDDIILGKQHIPAELCGTWYEIDRRSSYHQYLTINEDGSVKASYFSDGKVTEEQGGCSYIDGKIIFTYNNGGKWMQLYGAERSIVEWNPNVLILGYFDASFYAKNREETLDYIDRQRDPGLIGTWVYTQTSTASSTLKLASDGKGSKVFDSPIEHSTYTVIDWFTRNGWIYIKYSGKTSYTLYRYNISGDSLYLYYADILEISSTYDYHKQ